MDIISPLDFRVTVQVIEVPKIVCPPRAARTVLREPQLAEHLVEVPTPVSYSSLLQRTVEQNVDIPVAGGRGAGGGLSGFLPRQNSTALFPWNRTVDIPLGGGLQGFQRGKVQQRFWSSSPCLQIQVEVFQIVNQSRVPQRLLWFLLDTLVKVFFRTFPQMKKCDTTCALLVGTASALEPMDAGALWRADGARGGGGGVGAG